MAISPVWLKNKRYKQMHAVIYVIRWYKILADYSTSQMLVFSAREAGLVVVVEVPMMISCSA
jgi:hypothetical protein